MEKRLPYERDELLARATFRCFEGRALREVAFPLGGIGTGTVSLGGRGELRDWEIFGVPKKGECAPYTFFALWLKEAGGEPAVRVLQAPPLPPYTGAHGLRRDQGDGLPHMASARFLGSYPFARIAFEDPGLPLEVGLEAFNPFVPLDPESSGLPAAVFLWRLRNAGGKPVEGTLALNLYNMVGYDGLGSLYDGRYFGGNMTVVREGTAARGLFMTSERVAPPQPGGGSMALATSWPTITALPQWERGPWWHPYEAWYADFKADGRFEPREPSPSPEGTSDPGTLGLVFGLAPGEEALLPVVVAWYFPGRVNNWNTEEEVRGALLVSHYATRFADAWEVAETTLADLERLTAETRAFEQALHTSTLPAVVLDAASSQASTIRTNTCMWLDDGRFYAFEGCNDCGGCCPMNCTHVWNYEHALAYLFPSLERTMREVDFLYNTDPEGKMAFRTLVPIAEGRRWGFHAAADGQTCCVMKLYREWTLSGDEEFLRRMWPGARRALEYAWREWDKDRDGVMEGDQHNTYDINFAGANSMTTTYYLGALEAAARMAEHLGEAELAEKYRALARAGSRKLDEWLYNGEYYVEECDDDSTPYQYWSGCLSDQLVGLWFAETVGLGNPLPEEHVRSALGAIWRYNWRADLSAHTNLQRIYALPGEAGLLLCTWPRGGRPKTPFPYSDEVWTGIEYQVAAHMMRHGMIEEGLCIVKAARDRYDGVRRNPYNEVECGNHYARAMSSWSLILALSGFTYSAPEESIGFAPIVFQDDFRCFFSTGSGWGVYSQRARGDSLEAEIALERGSLRVRRVTLPAPGKHAKVRVWLEDAQVGARSRVEGDKVVLELEETARLAQGGRLRVALEGGVR